MNYEEWEKTVPQVIRSDSLWKMTAYRLALFLADVCWHDATRLTRDRRTRAVCDQLYRAVGSIGANLAEGYLRGTGRDRAHFYEHALGSTREARDWYYKCRHILGQAVADHRMRALAEVIRLLLTMVPQQRQHTLREEAATYQSEPDAAQGTNLATAVLDALLNDVPLPDA